MLAAKLPFKVWNAPECTSLLDSGKCLFLSVSLFIHPWFQGFAQFSSKYNIFPIQMPHGITRQFTYLDKINVFPLKPGVTQSLLCSLLENKKRLRKRSKICHSDILSYSAGGTSPFLDRMSQQRLESQCINLSCLTHPILPVSCWIFRQILTC